MKKRYPEYLKGLKKSADTAYELGSPFMSDEEYDAIFGESDTVGAKVGDVPHTYPMYSLQKHYAEDGVAPLHEVVDKIDSPKLDGAAVSLYYNKGFLTKALTRGDGKLGRPILDKMELLAPTELPTSGATCQVIGEVAAWSSVENSRNAASGSLGLGTITEFNTRLKEIGLMFVAYGIQYSDDYVGGLNSTYRKDMEGLYLDGFKTILQKECMKGYPTDGVVYRVNDNTTFNNMGFTAKHPRGAFALKTKAKPVQTKLLEVIWQTGKSGKVTPVAILEPVIIGEANISRATLNNMAHIESLNLEIGCMVKIIRAGEIIPTIVGRAD